MAKAYGAVLILLLAFAGVVTASQYYTAPGKKCECFDGDARCFFDGSRCPVSGGKCKCFKAPTPDDARLEAVAHTGCACGRTTAEAADFCTAKCPVTVGGEKCGAQCRLSSGHSGKHMCIKLHDF